MNGTPQLRSAYPSTPQSVPKYRLPNGSSKSQPSNSPAKAPPAGANDSPAIPFSFVDAPSQRLYVSLVYVGLFLWRLFDFMRLPSDGREGFGAFTKWVGIDTAFLYGLSGLNIPWLQWSSSTFTGLFIIHAVLNWMLMFQIPIPFLTWFGLFTKLLYDREYAVSERYVKPASILHNSSVILGKQIIHILPEGSVVLNPDRTGYCIRDTSTTLEIPIQINQTQPISMELTRIDLESNTQEYLTVSAKELKKLRKASLKEAGKVGPNEPLVLRYPVRETGLYRLHKVMDESKLEVQCRPSYALVASCPTASILQAARDKCQGDLSDFSLTVQAIPPLKIKYSKTINRDDRGKTFLSIQPDNLMSPLASRSVTDLQIPQDLSTVIDVTWAQSQDVKIPLNESLNIVGGWQYTIDEVHDACGNQVNFSDARISASRQYTMKQNDLEQHFVVHGRPKFWIHGCDAQNSMKVERGKSKVLPVRIGTTGGSVPENDIFQIKYLFTPTEEILPDQRHPTSARLFEAVIKPDQHGMSGVEVREPGLYSLLSARSDFCGGEILEPSSCQLINPPEPQLSISAKQIPDKCAGSSIGLIVDLDLMGTPPFRVYYNIKPSEGSIAPQMATIDRFHTQLELKPYHAGHYTYHFERISDAVYGNPRSLVDHDMVLEQDVRPPASARFVDSRVLGKVCIEEPVSLYLSLTGDPPFTLVYELVHSGKRQKRTITEITQSFYELQTQPLTKGGEYVLALSSITDATGCKQPLDAEAKFEVGLQRPRASFGQVDGRPSILVREGQKAGLPVRLQGQTPFMLRLRRKMDRETDQFVDKQIWKNNDDFDVDVPGEYEIDSVHDASCPGSVDTSANKFSVSTVPRPSAALSMSTLITHANNKWEKKAVCEGDEDATEVTFSGNSPFEVQYEFHHASDRGSQSTSTKSFTAGLDTASLKMETNEAGLYTYQVSKLGDASYKHDKRRFSPVKFEQRVYPKPSASFAEAGKVYKYCKNAEAKEGVIPINLEGAAPFHVEYEVKYHAGGKPEHISVPNVPGNQYSLRLPSRVLVLGSHSVTIRKVQDSRGCQRITDFIGPQVQVSVADVPSISPLEEHHDFCVGERISYALSGIPPFNVFYNFQGQERKAKVPTTDFRRIAEQPGDFIVTAISDSRSADACPAKVHMAKTIHEMPSVRVSKGKTTVVDIHEGGEAEILFEFGGTPPFHFTYTRSTAPPKGKKPTVLETKHGVSHEHSMTIRASDEGLYEVVSIRDKYCAFSTEQLQVRAK